MHVVSLSCTRRFFYIVLHCTVNCGIHQLLELTRLSISWYLTKTFHLSITQVISRLFVDCSNIPEETKNLFRFVTDRIDEWHAGLAHAIPLVPFPKDKLVILCVPTSQSSRLFLLAGSAMEVFIDVVSFLDIFFWFFTGDLDGETGLVVPKAFFGRCILPGTLVQILDHPTLPEVLPSLLGRAASTTMSIGWSRVIRWLCALVPALKILVGRPLSAYFFRHFEENTDADSSSANGGVGGAVSGDLLMKYAESFGYLPQRKSSSLVVSGSTASSAAQLRPQPAIDTHRGPWNHGSDERSDESSTEAVADNGANHHHDSAFTLTAYDQERESFSSSLATIQGIRTTPPASPVRSVLRSPTVVPNGVRAGGQLPRSASPKSPPLSPGAAVRFSRVFSVAGEPCLHRRPSFGDGDGGGGSGSDHGGCDGGSDDGGGSMYDIGLSLSSHALGDMHDHPYDEDH